MQADATPQRAPRTVACPKCGTKVVWCEASTYRPFCSARCKGMDFGAWASESYRVNADEESDPVTDQPS
jgi:endogenous inhibitor of DNA gyrase (YacG/DUF329 family)